MLLKTVQNSQPLEMRSTTSDTASLEILSFRHSTAFPDTHKPMLLRAEVTEVLDGCWIATDLYLGAMDVRNE
jgi:hypothetical protein